MRLRAPRGPGGSRWPVWVEVAVLVLLALVVAILVKAFLVQAYVIPSGSMQPTLRVGDRVLVDKVSLHVRDPRRGEVVVFDGVDSFVPEAAARRASGLRALADDLLDLVGLGPPGEHDFIKRVIGVAGDRVRCCDPDGRVTVNGTALDETSYLFPGNRPSTMSFDVVVPPGRLWVMGDHRAQSQDSRAHLGDPGGGMVPVDRVLGRAVAVVWPPPHWAGLGTPPAFALGAIFVPFVRGGDLRRTVRW
ncbi:MAG TPA: signal peptidase I [Actinomycetes bacterium]|nr:signal peptidase I [Actinomycetes bacterium]